MPGAETLIAARLSAVVIKPPGGAVHLKVNPVKPDLPIVVIPSKLYGLSGPAASTIVGNSFTVTVTAVDVTAGAHAPLTTTS